MKNAHYPCVLTIAGTDPSGGAGIQADIKAISATGSYAASVITALVAQNTQGVQAIQEINPAFVTKQLESVFNDLDIRAVKIGMLHNADIIEVIAAAIKRFKPDNIVFDPVMVAKDGSVLLKPDVIHLIKEKLFPLVDLITPNLFEAEKILGEKIEKESEMAVAAEKIANHYKVNVLLKGGHLAANQSSDVLYFNNALLIECSGKNYSWLHADRIHTKNTHGTGCTLSSAIASYLAQNHSLHEAIQKAKTYLTHAIQSGSGLNIGKGCGPVNHFYFLKMDC